MSVGCDKLPPLTANTAIVLLCPYSRWWSHTEIYSWLHKLPTPDQVRGEKFKHLDSRSQFIVARTILYRYLHALGVTDDQRFHLIRNDFGRLSLADNGIDFNISHTEGLIALTVSTSAAVGIDVEKIGRRGSRLDIASRFFHPREVAQINTGRDTSEKNVLFFRHWTMKESYVKAMGNGLQKSLQSFFIEFIDHDQIHVFDQQVQQTGQTINAFAGIWEREFCVAWTKLTATDVTETPAFYLLDQHFRATELPLSPQYTARQRPVIPIN